MEKTEVTSMLKEKVCIVTFTKVSGEERVMTATLKTENIPPKLTESTRTRAASTTDSIACYDINAKGWRSFKLGNMSKIEPYNA